MPLLLLGLLLPLLLLGLLLPLLRLGLLLPLLRLGLLLPLLLSLPLLRLGLALLRLPLPLLPRHAGGSAPAAGRGALAHACPAPDASMALAVSSEISRAFAARSTHAASRGSRNLSA